MRLHSDDRDLPEEEVDDSEESEDENAGTVVERKPTTAPTTPTQKSLPPATDMGHKRSLSHTEKLYTGEKSQYYPQARTLGDFSRTFASDDRPITPMKDKMVYDVEHSTLDFEDGKLVQ